MIIFSQIQRAALQLFNDKVDRVKDALDEDAKLLFVQMVPDLQVIIEAKSENSAEVNMYKGTSTRALKTCPRFFFCR